MSNANRYFSHLNTAESILRQYQGREPFAAFIKKFFAASRKYGSSDRRNISHLCYCYFRTGKILEEVEIPERIKAGLLLCSDEAGEMLKTLSPEYSQKVSLTAKEKLEFLNARVEDIFPCVDELSTTIERDDFILSHFVQPDVYLRLRPGRESAVKKKLKDADIAFEEEGNSAIALLPSARIESLIDLDKEAIVQDLSSQRVGDFLLEGIKKVGIDPGEIKTVWDCCAASGGKSILVSDLLGNIELTVSDVRESILANLHKRFRNAGIRKYDSFVADLTKENPRVKVERESIDLVIADVPCSGSGTWGRTPEQLRYFDCKQIDEYVSRQERIVRNTYPYLRKGGLLLYVTCSAYARENEEQVRKFEGDGMQVISTGVLKGRRADTMFCGLVKLIN